MIVEIKPRIINLPPQELYLFEAPADMVVRMQKLADNLEFIPEVKNRAISSPRQEINPEFKFFVRWVEACLGFVKDDLDLMCDRVEVTQMWMNRATKGYKVHKHHHPNSMFSAVYYVQDTNGTRFFQESLWSKDFGLLSPMKHPNQGIEHVYEHSAKAGQLLVFPSQMQHDSAEQTHEGYRYTMALNAFPKGVIGDYNKLSGMEL